MSGSKDGGLRAEIRKGWGIYGDGSSEGVRHAGSVFWTG